MARRTAFAARVATCALAAAAALVPAPTHGAAVPDEVRPPPHGAVLDYQIGGSHEHPELAAQLGVVVRDRAEAPLPGAYNVCYVNAFQTQPEEHRWWQRPVRRDLVLRVDGTPVVDDGWGEWLLDIRTAVKRERLARIVGRWAADCVAAGYDALEPDNLDSFLRGDGRLRPRHARKYARLLADRAHGLGLAVAQKNWAELGERGPRLGFDFAVAEECGQWRECGSYARAYDDRVLVVEYRRRGLERACGRWAGRLSVVLRDRAVTSGGRHRWCDVSDSPGGGATAP